VAKLSIKPGSTSESLYVTVKDAASDLDGGKTGIAHDAAGLVAYYTRDRAAPAAITLAAQTATGAWTSGGWAEVDGTATPGQYRLDIPNAALAAGVRAVRVELRGAAGMLPVRLEIDLQAELGPTALDAIAVTDPGSTRRRPSPAASSRPMRMTTWP
jgi:hypothetical protein